MISGVPKLPLLKQVCDTCVMAKQHKERAPKLSKTTTSRVLELIHSDICGPIRIRSLTGSRYFITFIDDYSRRAWVYFLSHKSEALSKFQNFCQMAEAETGERLATLRTDRGGEYLSHEFIAFCSQMGIKRQLTSAYSLTRMARLSARTKAWLRMPGLLDMGCRVTFGRSVSGRQTIFSIDAPLKHWTELLH